MSAPRLPKWDSARDTERGRPRKPLCMAPESWRRLDELAAAAGLARGAYVETLLAGVTTPETQSAAE